MGWNEIDVVGIKDIDGEIYWVMKVIVSLMYVEIVGDVFVIFVILVIWWIC